MIDCKNKKSAVSVACSEECDCKILFEKDKIPGRIITTHLIDVRSRNAIYNDAIEDSIAAAGSEAYAAQQRISKLIKR